MGISMEEAKEILKPEGKYIKGVEEALRTKRGRSKVLERIKFAMDFLRSYSISIGKSWEALGENNPERGELAKKFPEQMEEALGVLDDILADGETPENINEVIEYLEKMSRTMVISYPGGEKLPNGKISSPARMGVIFNFVGERADREGIIEFVRLEDLQEEGERKGTRDPLTDLENIRRASKSDIVKVSKDFWESQMNIQEDILTLNSIDEETKKTIKKKVKEGKTIAGSLSGLYGGSRYLKVFCLALAQTLNEQSKYFHTQEDLSGVPKELISQYAGEGAIVDSVKAPSLKFISKKEKEVAQKNKSELQPRPYPIVFLSWEDLAKKMSANGQISGGKDVKVVRDYVMGGVTKKKDPKTGREKEVFVQGLLDKVYYTRVGESGLIGVPLMSKIFSLYHKDSPDKEVGIAVQLSPHFALRRLIGYTGIRSDTIKLLGGAKQRELTLNLFMFLAYYRGIPPQKGGEAGVFLKRKEELLRDLSKDLSSYVGRPGLLEKHFQEAILKCIDAKILKDGKDRDGNLRGYREEINPGGEKISKFIYNPDYLKGEEINLFSEIEDQ